MQIPGHLAVALAQSNLPLFRCKSRRLLIPLFVASLFPDVVDKTIGYVFHAMPNGRHYAHNVFSLLGLSLLVSVIWGRSAGYAWFSGHLGHLLVDNDGTLPWFFPLKKYPFEPGRLTFKWPQLIRETLLLTAVLIIRQVSQSDQMDQTPTPASPSL